MTKDQMRAEILQLEPDNCIAKNDGAGHGPLKAELAAARRRTEARDRANAVPVTVHYRTEDEELMSWKFCAQGTTDPLTQLQFGDSLPTPEEIVDTDGTKYRIVDHSDGLEIVAGDLEVRDEFDQRRIYLTPNGTSVVFKRVEGGRIVLWSYKSQGEIMIGAQVPLEKTDKEAKPTASTNQKMTQKILASYIIAQNPTITGDQLTIELRDAFPSAHIGSRHGPHYLSLSRNGRLPEAPDSDPRTW